VNGVIAVTGGLTLPAGGLILLLSALAPPGLLRRIGPRQQHPRLDVDERRRHHEELPGDVEIHLLHQVDVLDVLRRNQRDGDVVDADLVALDQVQQQVERPLEIHQADRVRLENGLELLFHHAYLNFTASLTRSIVCAATTRAFFDPSCRISLTKPGLARTSARRR